MTLEVDGDVDLATDSTIEEVLDVSSLEPKAGDVVELVSVVRDEWTGPDGRDLVRSGPRRLRVVSGSTSSTSSSPDSHRSAIGYQDRGDQAELTGRDLRRRPGIGPGAGSLATDSNAGEMIEGIEDRLRENRIEDDLLEDVLEQASEMIESASEAADALWRLSTRRPGPRRRRSREASEDERARSDSEAEEAERQAEEAQREVRDELTDLASMLDRGEDARVVSRRIERLAEDLASLQERTGELSERTMGRERNELDPEDRRALDELARNRVNSRNAPRNSSRARGPCRRDGGGRSHRGGGFARGGPAGPAGGSRGGDARSRGAGPGEPAQQARQAQQRAAEAIEGMQEAIEESRKAVVDELRRRMESLAESLRAMLNAAEDEVIALSRLIAEEDDAGTVELRVEAMILLQRNVRALSGEAALADERIGRIVPGGGQPVGGDHRSSSGTPTSRRRGPPRSGVSAFAKHSSWRRRRPGTAATGRYPA